MAYYGNYNGNAFSQQMKAASGESGKKGFEQRDTEQGRLVCFGLHKIIKEMNKNTANEGVHSRRGNWDDF